MPGIKKYLKDLYRTKPSEKTRRGYLRLDMNESVSGLPEDFLKDVFSRIDSEFLATYPEYRRLEEKIALHNNLKPENICLSNGSDAAIKYIFDAYINSGDKILITDPTFAMYPVYCAMFNANPIIVEYKSDLTFPEGDFLKKISLGIKLLVIINPNNPAGSVIEPDSILSILKKAADNDILVIIDEAYFYFYPHTVIEQVKEYENLIVLRTFSKFFGIASARLGYAAACPEIIGNITKVRPTYDINGIAALLGEKLIDNVDIIQNVVTSLHEGKKYLIEKLSAENIEHKEGCANFMLIKCNDRVNEITRKLAEKNILVSNGFKQTFLKDYIRVTLGKKVIMEQFWQAFLCIWRSVL